MDLASFRQGATLEAASSHRRLTAQPFPTVLAVPNRALSRFIIHFPKRKGSSSNEFLAQPVSQEFAERWVIELGIRRYGRDFPARELLALIQVVQRFRLELRHPDHPFPGQRHETVALF